jgi:hypothetical protein
MHDCMKIGYCHFDHIIKLLENKARMKTNKSILNVLSLEQSVKHTVILYGVPIASTCTCITVKKETLSVHRNEHVGHCKS